jgi:hypothetical protein
MFKSGAADSKGFTEEELTDLMNKKTEVYYLKKGKTINDYKKETPPEQQGNILGKKPIHKIDNGNVIFLDIRNRPTIKKTFDQIVDVVKDVGLGDNAKKTQDILGRIKGDEEKMGKVAKFAEFIEKPENKSKVEEIEKMLI